MKPNLLIFIAIAFFSLPCAASWTLDNDASQISFVSVKAGDAGEAHRFTQISGSVANSGNASVTIQLASVDTMIPIRDERMRDILFETGVFPTATLNTKVDMATLDAMKPGESKDMTASISLDLRDQTVDLMADVMVARLGDHRLMGIDG